MNRRRAASLGVAVGLAFTGLAAAILLAAPGGGPAARTGAAARPVPDPAVTGPVTGGKGAIVLAGTTFSLRRAGYTSSEFFISGNARSYVPTSPLGSGGRWQVRPASTARYTTRIVVYRPASPARFNGTVVVEWLNVSNLRDYAVDWTYGHNELIRDGFAWVGVSAQAAGVAADKAADPVRYAALSHPGDSYSYDIFSQAGQAVRDSATRILGGLRPRAVLAEGASQSAFYLTTYVDAVQPLANVYNGFLIHSRGGNSADLSDPPQAFVPAPKVVFFRSDLRVPVLTVETETDLTGAVVQALRYLPAQQPDSSRFRLWEVAGASHADDYLANLGPADNSGTAAPEEFGAMLRPPASIAGSACGGPVNTGEAHYVLDAAVRALNRWVTAGTQPATAPRLRVNRSGSLVRDGNGNAEGGVRTPAVDVPVTSLSGTAQTPYCGIYGTTTRFSETRLAALYHTHRQFLARWAAGTARDAARGFLSPADAAELVAAAATPGVP